MRWMSLLSFALLSIVEVNARVSSHMQMLAAPILRTRVINLPTTCKCSDCEAGKRQKRCCCVCDAQYLEKELVDYSVTLLQVAKNDTNSIITLHVLPLMGEQQPGADPTIWHPMPAAIDGGCNYTSSEAGNTTNCTSAGIRPDQVVRQLACVKPPHFSPRNGYFQFLPLINITHLLQQGGPPHHHPTCSNHEICVSISANVSDTSSPTPAASTGPVLAEGICGGAFALAAAALVFRRVRRGHSRRDGEDSADGLTQVGESACNERLLAEEVTGDPHLTSAPVPVDSARQRSSASRRTAAEADGYVYSPKRGGFVQKPEHPPRSPSTLLPPLPQQPVSHAADGVPGHGQQQQQQQQPWNQRAMLWHRRSRSRSRSRSHSRGHSRRSHGSHSSRDARGASFLNDSTFLRQYGDGSCGPGWLLPYESLTIDEPLTTDTESQVFKGTLLVADSDDEEEAKKQGVPVASKAACVPVAIKNIHRVFVQQEQREFIEETEVLANLSHPSVVVFYGVALCGSTLLLVQELCDCSLRRVLNITRTANRCKQEVIDGDDVDESTGVKTATVGSDQNGPHLTDAEEPTPPSVAGCGPHDVHRLLLEIASGMAYVHGQGVIHRDLKPENVLLDSKAFVKIADFALARFNPVVDRTMTHCGTPYYMAPEVLNADRYGERVDVFSFAIMTWEICSLQPLYEGLCRWEVPAQVSAGTLRPAIPAQCPNFLRTFLSTAWSNDPAARPSFADVEELIRGWDAKQLARGWEWENPAAMRDADHLTGPTEL